CKGRKRLGKCVRALSEIDRCGSQLRRFSCRARTCENAFERSGRSTQRAKSRACLESADKRSARRIPGTKAARAGREAFGKAGIDASNNQSAPVRKLAESNGSKIIFALGRKS